jgi:hypothetical protein
MFLHGFRRMAVVSLLLLCAALPVRASDHVDSPYNAEDHATDLTDGYLFLDPNDNSRLVMLMAFSGFITPGENQNLGSVFSDTARYNFDIENTGDAVTDKSFHVTFNPKTSTTTPQTATIELPDGRTFTAPVTPGSSTAATAPTPVITTDPVSGVMFFAGLTDDPFFFDITGFARFSASVRAGAPDPTTLQRGRDSFAGFNVMAIALSVPVASLKGSAGNVIGMSQTSQRRIAQFITADGSLSASGRYVNVDRQGLPAINTVLVPFARKKEYNHASPTDDAAGRFAADLVAALKAFGTNDANIAVLAGLAVTRGDILRLDTSAPNSGPQGGTNAAARFPNGRRPVDDVIDGTLFIVTNGSPLGDNVNANDVPFRDTFPFLAPSHQPLASGCATQD